MSGATSQSTLPLSLAERVDVRRFCGYPAYGSGASGFQSWRFFQAYGLLEFRMTNMALEELQQTRVFLAQLYPLETAVVGASANLDTSSASVWVHNKNEVADRVGLYRQWRSALCDFIGVPRGPALVQGQRRII